MVDAEDRIYDVVRANEPPSWSHASKLQRSKSLAPSCRHSNYAVPRSINPPTPPPPRPIPPVPPRNRHSSEGTDAGLGMSLSCSPSDRPLNMMARNRTTSSPSFGNGMSKSPSILSVSSQLSVVEELTLTEFIAKYSRNLPLRVKVCKGFFGVSDDTAITTGDLFNFHFMKNTKVVVIEVTPGTQLSIPLTSSLKFSVLYDPNARLEEARRGLLFDTVGDLLTMKTLPKVVRATRAYQGSNADSSVLENELLVIRSRGSKLTGKQLKVYSLTAGKKKTLGEHCAGCFTTAPAAIQMQLYEISMHIQDTFPCRAVLYVGEDASKTVLSDLSHTVITLKQVTTENSVVATSVLGSDTHEVAEMPVDLDIEVEAVALDENGIDQLRNDTRFMYEAFEPSAVCLYKTKPTKRLYDIQCLLYKTLITGSEYRGLELLRPSSISQSSIKNRPYQQLIQENRDSTTPCMDYYVMMTPLTERSVSTDQTESDLSGESHTSEHWTYLETHIKYIERKLQDSQEEKSRMSKEIAKLTAKVDHLGRFCESLQTKIRIIEAENAGVDTRPPAPLPEGTYNMIGDHRMMKANRSISPSLSPSPSPSPEGNPLPELSNEEFLMSLSCNQVQSLLNIMGLKQYQEKFKHEQVNGEILAECDEEVLTNDLGMVSKLHRMRLMKVVLGRHSAQSILNGEDPYAHRKKQRQQ